MCSHRLAGGPLECDRTDEHEPGHGCIYTSTSGVPGYSEPEDDE